MVNTMAIIVSYGVLFVNILRKLSFLLSLLLSTNLFCDFNFDQAHKIFTARDDEAIIEFIEQSGINAQDKYKGSFFHYAINYNVPSIIDYLLSHHADIELRNQMDHTPLVEAVLANNYDWVKLFLDHNANIHVKTAGDNNNILHSAATMGTIKPYIVEYLIDHGLQVDEVNKYGKTPLQYVFLVSRPNYGLIKALIKRGADITKVKNNHGKNIFHQLIDLYEPKYLQDYKEIFNLILSKPGFAPLLQESYIRNTTKEKFTPVQYAIKEGHPELAALLQAQDVLNVSRELKQLYDFLQVIKYN